MKNIMTENLREEEMICVVKDQGRIAQSARIKAGRLRVAVYCRVSSQMFGRHTSLEEQTMSYTDLINGKPDWTLAGVYADRAKKNTRAQRPQFGRLVRDCENNLVDCILCESVSTLIRIERTEIETIRHLHEKGICLIFENEGMDTENDYFQILLSILESFAEEKYLFQSETSKQKRRQRAQAGLTSHHKLYGYRKAGDNFGILPEEAEVVRLIFRCYERGANSAEVAGILTEKEIPTPYGRHSIWRADYIRIIIENEKYAGDFRTQKYYKGDDGREHQNDGVLPSVYHRDHHPAIIGREQFERCNAILNLRKTTTPLQYPFGGYLRCPYCGHVLRKRRIPKKYCFCCEGEEACRKFVIMAAPVEEAILEAYKTIKMKAVEKKAALRDYTVAIEALKLLRTKAEYPVFERIDFWWLDELVEQISFGQHTCTCSELKKKTSVSDDRTISIHWRCGLVSTLPSGVKYDIHDPRRRAEQWDAFILDHPDRYPQLADEIRKQKDTSSSGPR